MFVLHFEHTDAGTPPWASARHTPRRTRRVVAVARSSLYRIQCRGTSDPSNAGQLQRALAAHTVAAERLQRSSVALRTSGDELGRAHYRPEEERRSSAHSSRSALVPSLGSCAAAAVAIVEPRHANSPERLARGPLVQGAPSTTVPSSTEKGMVAHQGVKTEHRRALARSTAAL